MREPTAFRRTKIIATLGPATKNEARIRCRVVIPGELKSRRHINLPGVKVNLPSFTEKDRGDKIVVATDIVAQDRLVDSVQLRTMR